MPFLKEFDDVYKLGIKIAYANAGAYAERVDEQIFQESILQRIYNQIDKADIIVSDMTGRNPNVFYETGYAHALGKQVILLTKDAADIPFDLKHYPHIVYGSSIADLIPNLEKRVKWAIEHPEETVTATEPLVEFYINGTSLSDSPNIDYFVESPEQGRLIQLKIDAHNPDDRRIEVVDFKVAFLTGRRLNYSRFGVGRNARRNNIVSRPKEALIHLPPDEFSILPGGWESMVVVFQNLGGERISIGDEENVTLRTLSEYGGHDYPFKIRIQLRDNRESETG